MEIPCGVAALSYLTATMVSYSVYVVAASCIKRNLKTLDEQGKEDTE